MILFFWHVRNKKKLNPIENPVSEFIAQMQNHLLIE